MGTLMMTIFLLGQCHTPLHKLLLELPRCICRDTPYRFRSLCLRRVTCSEACRRRSEVEERWSHLSTLSNELQGLRLRRNVLRRFKCGFSSFPIFGFSLVNTPPPPATHPNTKQSFVYNHWADRGHDGHGIRPIHVICLKAI
jgi:hypothetical protein